MVLLATTCLGSFFFGMYFVKIFSEYRLILHHFRFDSLSLIIYTLSLVKRLFGNLGINISAIALALASASPSALQMVYLLQQFFLKKDLCPINLNILSYTNLLGISIKLLQLLCQTLLSNVLYILMFLGGYAKTKYLWVQQKDDLIYC